MSYDPYNDPMNPVRKTQKYGLGSGNGGGNFEYGSGSRDIAVNPAEEGVAEGTTQAQALYTNFDSDAEVDALPKTGGGMA